MKLRLVVILGFLLGCAVTAHSETSLDKYLALRRQYKVDSIKLSDIKSNPYSYRGRVIELRGNICGIAKTGDSVSMIVDSPDGSFLVAASDQPDFETGSTVCVLASIGEKSTMSLSDLKLVSIIYECRVAEYERKVLAVAAAEKASALAQLKAQEAARKQAQTKPTTAPVSQYNPSVLQIVAAYKKAIKSFNPKLSDGDADVIARSIIGFSSQYKVDPRLMVAVILAESHFRPTATSGKGAMGLGQLMPGTAAGLGIGNAYDPVANVKGSVRLIKGHLDKITGKAQWNDTTWHDLSLALASYNAGPGAVRKYGGVPPYRETQAYIKRVLYYYKQLCGVK